MDTYRSEKQAMVRINLEDEDAFIEPSQVERAGGIQEPLMEFLSIIVDEFNKLYGPASASPNTLLKPSRRCPKR